ncbi:MAG: 4Fe-4S dicluster domain-containing protein [Candidatus Cloacimonetes bacterium]|nr:4Fe-4S dicluster domain-containing protein [Candidatus Cloacimonadota bacterium]
MTELQNKIRELLEDHTVDLVIGWENGSLPLVSSPVFIKKAEDAGKVNFDVTCRNNLTTYLTKDRRQLGKDYQKIGIVVKGCDARSVVLYVTENQVKREKVFLIGVPCQGVLEKKKIFDICEGREVLEKRVEGENIIFKGHAFEIKVPFNDVLSDSCLGCRYPDAREFDAFIGTPRGELEKKDEFKVVDDFEKKTPEERWAYIKDEYSRCIRCYACRNVCPSCYCNECFVDHNDPQWIGKTPEVTDNIIFHLIRNLHLAGRCVDCGACVSACPVNLDLRIMNKKVEKEMKDRFNYTAGLDINEKPAMATYCENEKQDFIMG